MFENEVVFAFLFKLCTYIAVITLFARISGPGWRGFYQALYSAPARLLLGALAGVFTIFIPVLGYFVILAGLRYFLWALVLKRVSSGPAWRVAFAAGVATALNYGIDCLLINAVGLDPRYIRGGC